MDHYDKINKKKKKKKIQIKILIAKRFSFS